MLLLHLIIGPVAAAAAGRGDSDWHQNRCWFERGSTNDRRSKSTGIIGQIDRESIHFDRQHKFRVSVKPIRRHCIEIGYLKTTVIVTFSGQHSRLQFRVVVHLGKDAILIVLKDLVNFLVC
jgi:hypothetical protein